MESAAVYFKAMFLFFNVDPLFIVALIISGGGGCVWSLFCNVVLSVISSFVIQYNLYKTVN